MGKTIDIRRTRTCEKCKAVIPLDKVKLFPKNKEKNINMVVCVACCEQLKKTENQGLPTTPVKNVPQSKPKIFRCTRCNYTFRVDMAKIGVLHNLACPYCGKADRLEKTG